MAPDYREVLVSSPTELSLNEINARMRARAEAVLAGVGLNLELTGHMWSADIVCVTSRERSALVDAEREALDKAVAALGYNPVQMVVISTAEVEAACRPSLVDEALGALIELMNPMAVVYLDAPARNLAPATSRLTVGVTDFFGSLADPSLKRVAWMEMQPARRKPAFR